MCNLAASVVEIDQKILCDVMGYFTGHSLGKHAPATAWNHARCWLSPFVTMAGVWGHGIGPGSTSFCCSACKFSSIFECYVQSILLSLVTGMRSITFVIFALGRDMLDILYGIYSLDRVVW